MPPRKKRIAVVLDTNVLIAFYSSRNSQSLVRKLIRLWRNERKLQLIVSEKVVDEYLEVLERLGVSEKRIGKLAGILETLGTVTKVSLGKIPT